jgi:chromate transporter
LNPLLLYILLLKATLTTFSGLGSVPVLRTDLVQHHHVLTDEQLNVAIVVTRSTPGPAGFYVVSVGYFAGGTEGAIAGWGAMVTPAIIGVAALRFLGKRAQHPRAKAVVQAVILASAGLLWASAMPLARESITDPVLLAILLLGIAVLASRKVEALWVIVGSALIYLGAAALRLVAGL